MENQELPEYGPIQLSEPQIEIQYNDGPGLYKISDEAEELYRLKKKEVEHIDNGDFHNRQSVLLLRIYNQLKERFSGNDCTIKVKTISQKYQH